MAYGTLRIVLENIGCYLNTAVTNHYFWTSNYFLSSDVEDDKEPLNWDARIKIAVGAARGIEYLHCKANPPVIYRDLKSANILLDNEFNPKLSDFGLAKLGPVGDNTHVSTRVMGTYGYCAPEYAMSGKLTLKSDIYSFGVVLLELITGRKAIDMTKRPGEQNLVCWVSNKFCYLLFFPFFNYLWGFRIAVVMQACWGLLSDLCLSSTLFPALY